MKRKAESVNPVDNKILSLSTFAKEENLDVDGIENDVDEFIQWYDKFVKFSTEILDKKDKVIPSTACSFILKFKDLNRKSQFRLSVCRDRTKETKDAINKNHLIMQNLLYEALHLEKETNSCLEYKCLFSESDLVPVEQFMSEAPDSMRVAETEHELFLNRMHWELEERRRLAEKIKEAEDEEKRLIMEISKKNRAFEDVSDHLRAVFAATKPLEDTFQLPLHYHEQQDELARGLSESLYVLYMQMLVHADVFDPEMSVRVERKLDQLSVVVLLEKLELRFVWDDTIEMICVQPQLIAVSPSAISFSPLSQCLINPNFLLSELVDEQGCPMQSPWVIAKLNKTSTSETVAVDTQKGLPYVWCQRLAGTFGNMPRTNIPLSSKTTERRIQTGGVLRQLLDDIRARIELRMKLAAEFDRLSSSSSSLGSGCIVDQWAVSSFDKFQQCPDSKTAVDTGIASEQCFFFSARIRPSKYQMDQQLYIELPVFLVVPHCFPSRASFIVLVQSSMTLTHRPPDLSMALNMAEMEVNCHNEESSTVVQIGEDFVSVQLGRLRASMDVLFECLAKNSDNALGPILLGNKFPQSKRPFKSA